MPWAKLVGGGREEAPSEPDGRCHPPTAGARPLHSCPLLLPLIPMGNYILLTRFEINRSFRRRGPARGFSQKVAKISKPELPRIKARNATNPIFNAIYGLLITCTEFRVAPSGQKLERPA
jgi:hypothetical protein